MRTNLARFAVALLAVGVALSGCSDRLEPPLAPSAAPPAGAGFGSAGGMQAFTDELYLIDNICPSSNPDGTCAGFGNGSILYHVDLVGTDAVITHLFGLQGACAANAAAIDCSMVFDQSHIGATPDGDRIWAVQRRPLPGGGNPAGYYSLSTGQFTYAGEISNIGPDGVVLAAFSPLGELFVANIGSDRLYRVDLGLLAGVQSWRIRVGDAAGPFLVLAGADIAFDLDGRLYLYTNRSGQRGLYEVVLPAGAGDAVATFIGNFGDFFTGLAVRAAGTGNLVMSNAFTNRIVEVNRQTGAVVATYQMTGDLTNHRFGDMTTGRLGPPPPTGICEGGVNKLVVRYVGSTPLVGATVGGQRRNPHPSGIQDALVSVVGGVTLYTFATKHDPHFGQFDPVANGRLANNFRLFVDGTLNIDFHTSCSAPIYPGLVVGDFEIVDVWSVKGGQIGPPS